MAEEAHLLFMVLALTLAWTSGVGSQRCGNSLGAGSQGYLPPTAFNASSFSKWHEPQKGRIGNPLTAWMPEDYKPNGTIRKDFLEVDLGAMKAITGVKVQGFPTNDFYVQTLYVLFSKDGGLYYQYLEGGVPKRFDGNVNSTLIKTIRLGCEVHARYVRFHPLHFKGGIALNVDVLGCEIVRGVDPSVKDFAIKLSSSPRSVQLEWEQVKSNVREFHLTVNGKKKPVIKVKSFTMLPVPYSLTIGGLEKCTKYLFVLHAFGKSGCGIPEVHKLTYLARDKVSPPTNFESDTSIPGTVMLSWQKPVSGECNTTLDEVSGYKIMYRATDSPSSSPSQRRLPGDMTSYTLPGLDMWKSYDINIQAFSSYPTSSSGGSGGGVHEYFSGMVLLSDVLVQGKPPTKGPNITVLTSEKPQTMLLQWQDPSPEKINGAIVKYTVFFRTKGVGGEWASMDVDKEDGSTHSVTVTGDGKVPLQPWQLYEVYVSLFNQKFNASSAIKEVIVYGKAPGKAPGNLKSTLITEDSVVLSWDQLSTSYIPSSQGVVGYKVFYQEGQNSARMRSYELINKTTVTARALKSGTVYKFSVAAVSNGLVGPVSDQIEVTTLLGPLSPPLIEFLESTSVGSFYVVWKVVSNVKTVDSSLVKYKEKGKLSTWTTLRFDNVTRSTTVENLVPWQQYDVKILLRSRGRESESDLQPVLVRGKAPGRSPTNVIVSNIKYKKVTLQWQPIDPFWVFGNLTKYTVKYSTTIDPDNDYDLYTNTTKLVVPGLQPNTNYQFQVAGVTEGGVGKYSTPVKNTTKKVKDPAIPMNVKVQNVNPSKIMVGCSVNGEVNFFEVLLEEQATGKSFHLTHHITIKRSLHEYSLTLQVKPYTRYLIKLKSCILDRCSKYSKEKSILTRPAPPSEVRKITISQKDKLADPVVSWERPKLVPGVLQRYILNVVDRYNASAYGYPLNIEGTRNSYEMKDLPPYTKFNVTITAVTVGPGPLASKMFTSPEGVPSAPSNFRVILSKDATISLKWEPPLHPNGVVDQYKIEYIGSKDYYPSWRSEKNVTVSRAYPPEGEALRIKGLVPGTTYTVSICARTGRGYGDINKYPRDMVTPVKAPKAPPPPMLMDEVTSTTVTVTLQKAEQISGRIDNYQLVVEEIDDKPNSRARVRRALPSTLTGYVKGTKVYIAANIDAVTIDSPTAFVVGNDRVYGGYQNHPLKPGTGYTLHFRAMTKPKTGDPLYGEFSKLPLPRTLALPTVAAEPSSPIPIALIVGLVAGVIVLIFFIVILVKCRRSAKKKEESHSPYEIRNFKAIATAEETEEMLPPPIQEPYPLNPDHLPVAVSQFPKHVAKLHRNDNAGFKSEYSQLKIGKESPWDVAHQIENKPKNRYANIVAYDHSRVKLSRIHGVAGSDYINASYIDGYRKPNAYVSTQGPLPSTYNDFWRMVWELKSKVIVMLTNLQEKNKLKCHKYWPDDSTVYSDIKVTLVHNDSFADFIVRTFRLEDASKERVGSSVLEVRQFHFTAWPDHGVPQHATPLLNFRRNVREVATFDAGPTVVHCSAGVGRTGAYIAMDSMLERMELQKDVDLFNFIANMRMRRIAMVQTEDQYVFVHDTIVEAISNGNTEIMVGGLREAIKSLDLIDSLSKVSKLEMQWKTLNQGISGLYKNDSLLFANQPENVNKNRYSTVLPMEFNRVLLTPIDESEASTYINATYVNSYKQKNAYILTQSPLPRTVFDFWRMVSEHGISSIVMLNAVDEGDDYVKFWPEFGKQEYDMVSVECIPDGDTEDVTWTSVMKPMYRTQPAELVIKRFQVLDKRSPSKPLTVKLFQYIGWTETRVPNTYRPIISLLSHVERWQEQTSEGIVTIMCSDGIGRSGTLAGIMHVLERVKIDKVFDCFQAVKAMRIQRPHAVKYMDQYKYIHNTVMEYLNAFQEHTKI